MTILWQMIICGNLIIGSYYHVAVLTSVPVIMETKMIYRCKLPRCNQVLKFRKSKHYGIKYQKEYCDSRCASKHYYEIYNMTKKMEKYQVIRIEESKDKTAHLNVFEEEVCVVL